MRIAVCDVGLGNLRSVERALMHAGGKVEITTDPEKVRTADKVVMPGQGGFGDCARALASGLGDAVKEQIARGAPYLGICLGLQVLFGSSEEAEGCAGLGVFPGRVIRLARPPERPDLKIPHTGWNTAEPRAKSVLPEAATYFYFVHSYVVVPEDPGIVAATTDYGEPFVSAVVKDNVFACQFHPEKSQRAGIALLERFVRA